MMILIHHSAAADQLTETTIEVLAVIVQQREARTDTHLMGEADSEEQRVDLISTIDIDPLTGHLELTCEEMTIGVVMILAAGRTVILHPGTPLYLV